MIDRRVLTNFDWLLMAVLIALGLAGVLNLYSAAGDAGGESAVYLRQLTWLGLGLGVMIVVALIGYHRLVAMAWPMYLLLLASLVAVLLWGKVVGGSQRWLSVGPVAVQPSEVARLVVILVLAHYFSRREQSEAFTIRQLIPAMIMSALPAVLIIQQPDLGTSILLVVVAGSVILVNGIKLTSLALLTATLLPAMLAGWSFLKDYQKRRIFSFLDPESDPLGAAYHIIQSKIAVGSGQLTGKGFMAGTQTQLHFLPEQHTDFAFSVLAEEWGFMGAAVVLTLLLVIIYRGLYNAWKAKDRMGMLVVVGATACIFWPTVINVGMVLGLFPVVGIPLPFISYGGSSTLTTMAAMGLIQGVSIHRFIFVRN